MMNVLGVLVHGRPDQASGAATLEGQALPLDRCRGTPLVWLRIDDQIAHHPKFIEAGPIASWLWICGNAYCNKYLTDGFIRDSVLTTLGNVPTPKKWAAALVGVGLWTRHDGGYQVHDFLDFNPAAREVKARRHADRIRKESARNPLGHNQDSAGIPHGHDVDSAGIPDASRARVPSHPIPSSKKELSVPPKEPADPRVRQFLEWFPMEYKLRRAGADYLVRFERDSPLVKTMLKTTTYARLQRLAQVMLSDKCDEPFIVNTDRGIGILSTKFNWLSDRLAAWEAKQATS